MQLFKVYHKYIFKLAEVDLSEIRITVCKDEAKNFIKWEKYQSKGK